MHELFPNVFVKFETIGKLGFPIRVIQLPRKIQRWNEQRKQDLGYFLNADKIPWGKQIIGKNRFGNGRVDFLWHIDVCKADGKIFASDWRNYRICLCSLGCRLLFKCD